MAVTKTYKVYGMTGHRQHVSFEPSVVYDFSSEECTRILDIRNSDKTGTNEYTIVVVTRNTAEECENEIWGQVSDGIFENARVGKVEEIANVD